MKKNILVLFCLCLSFKSMIAQCKIKVTSDEGKPIVFLISIKGTQLELMSDLNGELIITDSLMTMYGKKDIAFRYHHNLDHDYYRTPQFVRKNRLLGDVCGQNLVAIRRD